MKKIICFIVIVLIITGCGKKNTNIKEKYKDDIIKKEEVYDPYSTENKYDIDASLFKKNKNTKYGNIETIKYYSKTANDYKNANVLFPPNYDKNTKYPILYFIHGWDGKYSSHVNDESYLYYLQGNMLANNLAKPMIIIGVDMYTDKLSEKNKKTDEEKRFIYDKVIDDIALDLMPYIENKYNYKHERTSTAIAGISQGGSESLATGFKYLDKFAYIASLAPDTGVIPTEWFKGTFWNTPIFDEFPMPTKENMPKYLYLAVGSKDPWNIECTKYYGEVLNKMGIKNQTDYVKGFGHDYKFWRVCMYNFMNKIFR